MKRFVAILLCFLGPLAVAQNARIHGLVKDPSQAVIVKATVTLTNIATGNISMLKSNGSGAFVFASVSPGKYSLSGEAPGFDKAVIQSMRVEVDADVTQDITLKVKQGTETVTVTPANSQLTEAGGAVSTVIDHDFIEDMPLNGNSLSTLFELTPGVVTNASGGNSAQGGGLSVNGQRGTSNYLTVDGASANIYIPLSTGASNANITGQGLPVSASGGTNGLLPTDAVEEYRIQTSTYSAEYGRTPGGQIGVKTRGGTNEFHGSLFENLRNQVMDATDYFVKYLNEKQAPLRMNDFGGTVGGPILRNELFFFIAHESLLMRQPQPGKSQDVPSSCARSTAAISFQPLLAAYPVGNAGSDTTTQLCYPNQPGSSANQPISDIFNESFSNKIKDHSTSLRLDATLPWRSRAFFRISDAPSDDFYAGWSTSITSNHIWTATGGVTSQFTPNMSNELTANYSQNQGKNSYLLISYGGNNPSAFANAAASAVDSSTSLFEFGTYIWTAAQPTSGPAQLNGIKSWNAVDTLTWTQGRHSVKAGADYLWRNPVLKPYTLSVLPTIQYFASIQSGIVDQLNYTQYYSNPDIQLTNISFYANDAWRTTNALILSYGLRWDINPSPSAAAPGFFAIQGDLSNPLSITQASTGTPLFQTRYTNVAPRLGIAYHLHDNPHFGTAVRGGFGIFFDTGSAAVAAQAAQQGYPYQGNGTLSTISYSSINWKGLASSTPSLPQSTLYVTDPHIDSPRTYQWSVTVEQGLGPNSTLSTSYVANNGQKLASTIEEFNFGATPTPVLSAGGLFQLLTNGADSSYQSLQMQLRSQMGHQLNAVASWTWSHNIDSGSSDFTGSNTIAEYSLRADSANDVRHIFSAAIHYSPSGVSHDRSLEAITKGWSLDTIALLQTASPVSVRSNLLSNPSYPEENQQFNGLANVVPGVPIILHSHTNPITGVSVPGGVMLNPAAFARPSCACNGNSVRNGYRLFGLTQWDLAGSRSWSPWERATFSFRVDAFNILNVANFANVNSLYNPNNLRTFGEAQNTYAGNFGSGQGSLNTVFQNGGARSLQLSAKISF